MNQISLYQKTVSRRIKKNNFLCCGKNTEKYIIFTVSIQKEVTRIGKNGEEIMEYLCQILHFIERARFTVSSLSNLVNNYSERIYKIKCKQVHEDKKCEIFGTEYKYCNC